MAETSDMQRRQERARRREALLEELREKVSNSAGKVQQAYAKLLADLKDDNTKATQEDADESARRADEIATYAMLLVRDAKGAWDSGSSYYLPAMPLTYDGGNEIARAVDAETALAAVGGVGWKLHTWTVDGGRPRPLFSRE